MKKFYFNKFLFSILILMSAFLFPEMARSQTTLVAGDLAFMGLNTTANTVNGGATDDRDFTFILLTNISAGTIINFTDFGWRSDAQAFQTANSCGLTPSSGAVTDGIIQWTSSSALPYGTKINIRCRYTATTNIGTITATQQTYNSTLPTATRAEYVTMTVAGESIFAYQGAITSPTLIAGACFAVSGWNASLLNCDYNSTSSALPAALSTGNTAFALTPTSTLTNFRLDPGLTIPSTAAAARALISNENNWQYADNLSPYSLAPSAPPAVVPTITTDAAAAITTTSATLGGNATADGGATITERGVVYSSTNTAPTTGDTKNANGSSTGAFSESTTGLNPSTTYYVRAYATNSVGTAYGAVISFTTQTPCVAPTIVSNPPDRSICAGNNTTFSVSVSGALTYQWQVDQTGGGTYTNISNGAPYSGVTTNVLTITGAPASMKGYRFRAVAFNGAPTCLTNSTYGTLNISNITLISSQTNVNCFGGSNGVAVVLASGGIGSYSYSWFPSGGVGSLASGLAAGTYTVTVTDGIGCPATQSFTITAPATALSATTTPTSVSCFGGSNGTINLTPSGGTAPYTFLWNGGATTEDRTALTQGTYSVTITDAKSCTFFTSATVTEPLASVSGTTIPTLVSCFGGSNGTINLTPSGGTAPYTFLWDNGTTTTEDRTGLTAGTYTVTITDSKGCTGTVSATVLQPLAPVSGATILTPVSCFGGSNGAINLTPSGGTAPYTFLWNNGTTTTEDRSGLAAGTYMVTITDAKGCTGTVNATVLQPTAVSGTATPTSVSCFTGSNGSINLTPSGGTSGYTFLWNDGVTTEDRTGLIAGTYTVIITDANSCTGTVSAIVLQPAAAVSGTLVPINVSCLGGSNASINLTPSGGTAPYTFLWNGGATTEDRTGLLPGTYTVTITDSKGCTGTASVTITQPATTVQGTATQTNVSCYGGINGSITPTVSGGTAPYTYSWTDGSTAKDRTGLNPGTYFLTFTDANGCSGNLNRTITEPAMLVATPMHTNVTCNGSATGSATVSLSGGTLPYSYSWTGSTSTTNTATDLVAGSYAVEISDGNGCTAAQTFTITEPAALTSSGTQTNVSCHGLSTGSATVTALGGTGAYTYSWLPLGGNAATASNLPAGTYTVTVKDANLCSTVQTFTLTEPGPITLSPASLPSAIVGVPYSAIFVSTGGSGSYIYTVPSGTIPPGLIFSGGILGGTPIFAGSYTFTINGRENGCNQNKSITYTVVVGTGSQSITFNNIPDQNYGNTPLTLAATSSSGLPVSYTSANPAIASISGNTLTINSAGTVNITASQAGDISYDPATDVVKSLLVNPKAITVAADAGQTKSYGATDPVFNYTTNVPLIGSDVFSGALTRATGENVGSYAITQGNLALNSNYTLSYTGNNFAVIPTPLTITATGPAKPYGVALSTSTGAGNFTFSATQNGELVNTVVLTPDAAGASAVTPAGSPYVVTPSGATGSNGFIVGNYNITYVPFGGTVGLAAQNITFNPLTNAVYGDAPIVLNATASSGLAINYSSSNPAVATVSGTTLTVVGAGSATITATQAGSSNYNPATPVAQPLTVNQKILTITATAAGKVYDGNTSATVILADNRVAGDVFTVNYDPATFDNQNASAGKTVTVNNLSLPAAAAVNYSFNTSTTTTANITKRLLAITASAANKEYDGTISATVTLSDNRVANEVFTVSYSSASFANINAGTGKTVTVTNFGLPAGAANNYTFNTNTTAIANITQKLLTITADNKTKFQGTANPVLTASYIGFITGENNSNLLTQPVLSTPVTTASAQGVYPITVSAATASNYTIAFVPGTLTVTPGFPTSLTLTAVPVYENRLAGTSAGSFSSVSQDPGAIFTYTLVTGAGSTDNPAFSISGNTLLTAQSFDFEAKNSYSIRVRTTTQYGLSLEQAFTVNVSDVNEIPTLAAIADQAICYTTNAQNVAISGITAGPETAQSTTISVSSSNPDLFATLAVSKTGAAGVFSYSAKTGASGTATVTVTVQDNGGTANSGTDTFSRTFTVSVFALPTPAISSNKGNSVGKGETIQLMATGGTSYTWIANSSILSGQNTAVLTVRPSVTTTYTVTATNANGCSESSSYTIAVESDYSKLVSTNLLTPNGDGINDKWVITNIDLYGNNEAKVFDAAGKLVYTKKNYDNTWDGTYNGVPLTEGTYYYIVDFGPGKGRLKGFVTVIRNSR